MVIVRAAEKAPSGLDPEELSRCEQALVAKADRMGINPVFPSYIGLDDKMNTQYAFTMVQGGIGLPDRDYYLVNDDRMKASGPNTSSI